jgi:hypothetical protein
VTLLLPRLAPTIALLTAFASPSTASIASAGLGAGSFGRDGTFFKSRRQLSAYANLDEVLGDWLYTSLAGKSHTNLCLALSHVPLGLACGFFQSKVVLAFADHATGGKNPGCLMMKDLQNPFLALQKNVFLSKHSTKHKIIVARRLMLTLMTTPWAGIGCNARGREYGLFGNSA